MNVAALRHAGIGALADRGRQAFTRFIDRVAADARGEPAATGAVTPDAATFFAGASADPAAFVDAGTRASIVAAADAAAAGRFDLLGYRALHFGDPPDWHFDPVSGRRAPLRHWTRIDTLDHAAVGDHKVIWELNRHQWLIDLGDAWRLTGDARYAQAAADALDGWMRANPPGIGINWASSLEAAYRLLSWCWALFLFADAPGFDAARRSRLTAWIAAHARHVERYLSHYYSPNTHLTGEALGLFAAGCVLRGTRDARRWRRTGARILCAEVGRQVLDDGVYFEHATCYQRYTAEIYLSFIALAARNGHAVPTRVRERVRRLVDALLWFRGPDGRLPVMGDDDGGSVFRAPGRTSDDPSGVFAVAAVLFDEPAFAWAAGSRTVDVFRVFGSAGCAAFDALVPAPPSAPPSRAFPDGGYAVLRSDWGPHAHRLLFDAGPLGCPVSGGHGHADLLSVQVHAFGRPVIVDPGTGSYVPEPEWRDAFRASSAHSTAVVDRRAQAETTGPFSWRTRPAARLRRWHADTRIEVADAEHDAYAPVTHRRRVAHLKSRGTCLLVDEFTGDGEHVVELNFQLAPGLEPRVGPDARVTIPLGGARFVIQPLRTAAADVQVTDAWVSPAYGQRARARRVTFRWRTTLPFRAVLSLAPRAGVC